jgi:hypothetical protein
MLTGSWFSQVLAEDLATSISAKQKFASFDTMIRAVRYVGASEEALHQLVEEDGLDEKGRGAIWIDLVPGRRNLLLVYPQWLPK